MLNDWIESAGTRLGNPGLKERFTEEVFCCVKPVPLVLTKADKLVNVASSPDELVSIETDPPATLELKSRSTAVNVPRPVSNFRKEKVVFVDPIVGEAL